MALDQGVLTSKKTQVNPALGIVTAVGQRQLRDHLKPISFGNSRIERRVRLYDLRDKRRWVELPSNPETLEFTLSPEFVRTSIRGLPYEPLHYDRTRNMKVDMSFVLEATRMDTENVSGPNRILTYLAFFQGLCYIDDPVISSQDVSPVARLEWPGIVAMNVVVSEFHCSIDLFTHEPQPLPRFVTVDLSLEEWRRDKIFARSVVGDSALGIPGKGFFHTEAGKAVVLPRPSPAR